MDQGANIHSIACHFVLRLARNRWKLKIEIIHKCTLMGGHDFGNSQQSKDLHVIIKYILLQNKTF